MKKQRIILSRLDLLNEIKEKKTFKNVEKIKAGKLKGRPAEELLNEV